ncbi:hypothetical protein ZWY2020_039737 [Hordeum vulgare]|nr:hypothetical protein ZWY2020_039737 [Hordeum vulgare]
MSGRRGRGGGGRRPTKAEQLMHGAIDHFGRMGYAEADIRNTVRQLIEVYGEDASSFLKEDDYRVVQDALFEKQEQEEEPKQKEAAISEAPVASGMHNEMPPGAELSVEGADPMLIDPRASEATMSLDDRRCMLQFQEAAECVECEMKPHLTGRHRADFTGWVLRSSE